MSIWGGKGGTDTGRYYDDIFFISKNKIKKKYYYCRDE